MPHSATANYGEFCFPQNSQAAPATKRCNLRAPTRVPPIAHHRPIYFEPVEPLLPQDTILFNGNAADLLLSSSDDANWLFFEPATDRTNTHPPHPKPVSGWRA